MTTKKETPKSNFKMIIILIIIIVVAFFYIKNSKDSLDDTYTIKTAGGEGGYRASFINRTGKQVEDKKIKLSDGYWTGGKFGF